MNIVRTDTLFGSKKNIIGSTSADLVLETLGKVYIKTGKSAKTLTEILSEYSKKSGNETSGTGNITTEQIQNLLSAEYIKSLVDQVLKEHKIYGNFVTTESLQGVGNQNLPIYFDINSEPQTITGLEVTNKIYTDDEVRGEKGVSTAGVSDLTVIGGYAHGLDENQLRGLGYRTETELTVSFNSLLNSSLSGYKPLQEIITLTSQNVKTVGSITQSASGIIEATFIDIPDAGAEQKGFVNTENQVFSGNKTFNNSVTAVEQVTTPIINTSNIKAETQLNITTNNSKRADFTQNGLAVVGGVSASGICDLTPIGGYNDNIINSLSGIGTFRGTFESESDLPTSNYQGNVLQNNDYAFTIELSGQNPEYVRWKYNGTQWVKEYTITNSGFTADQWTTINSGLTSIGGNTITTLGTIIIGTWNGSAIVDDYISSASTWNSASSTISTISEYFDSNNKLKQANLDATAIINALGNNAVNRATSDRNGLIIDTNYLKSDGSKSMTGTLTLRTNAYKLDSTAGLDCKNSDIINVNSIYTADVSGSWKESIAFVRSGGTTYDTFRAAGGTFYFGFNNIHTNQAISGNEYVTLTSQYFKISRSDTNDSSVTVENSNRNISLLASTNGGIYDNKTSKWIIGSNGTNTFLNQGDVTFSNHVILYNEKGIYWNGKSYSNSTSNDNYQVLMINSSSELHIGYGTSYKGGDFTVLNAGRKLYLRAWEGGSSNTKYDIIFDVNKSFYPSINNDINLGSSSNQWKEIYANDVYATRGVAAGGIADLTIAYSNSVIQSLQAQIDALQDQIDALS